jgi:cephalosporin hydroxylase
MQLGVETDFPNFKELVAELEVMARTSEPIARYLAAHKTGTFVHPDGRTDDLGPVRLSPQTCALLSHLCGRCTTSVSVEVGFGMGSSATVILATRTALGRPFEHLIFDPYGLGNGRGDVVHAYLRDVFGTNFKRFDTASEIGLGQLLKVRGPRSTGLVFIDGGHRFENVMTDFVLADRLCSIGGYIVFDDALFPAIETVINYIVANRPDYAVSRFPANNVAVARKIGADRRHWYSFTPFEVPDRHDWTAPSPAKS